MQGGWGIGMFVSRKDGPLRLTPVDEWEHPERRRLGTTNPVLSCGSVDSFPYSNFGT